MPRKHPFANDIKRIAMFNKGRYLSKLLMNAINSELGITRRQLMEKNRKREKTDARAIYIKLLHDNGVTHKCSTHFIDRDVSAYHYNVKMAENLIDIKDSEFMAKFNKVKNKFQALRAETKEPNELDVPSTLFERM